MLPSISFVESVEMIRDGGSLAAIFNGSNGANYWLFIKIEVKISLSGEWQRERYLPPIIVEREIGTAIEISWQHAKVFLNQMRSLLRGPRDQQVLEIMITLVNTEGKMSYENVVDLMNANNSINAR